MWPKYNTQKLNLDIQDETQMDEARLGLVLSGNGTWAMGMKGV